MASLAMLPGTENQHSEEELLLAEAGTVAARGPRMARGPLAVGGLLLVAAGAVALHVKGGQQGAAVAQRSKAQAWFQKFGDLDDCATAKISGGRCLMAPTDKGHCDSPCLARWQDIQASCRDADGEMAAKVLSGCKQELGPLRGLKAGVAAEPADLAAPAAPVLAKLKKLAGDKGIGELLSSKAKDLKGLPGALQAKLKGMKEKAPADFGAAAASFGDMLAPKSKKEGAAPPLPLRDLKEEAGPAPEHAGLGAAALAKLKELAGAKAEGKDLGDMLPKHLPAAVQAKMKELAEAKAKGSEAPADFGAPPADFGDMLAPAGKKGHGAPPPLRDLKEQATLDGPLPDAADVGAAATPMLAKLKELGAKAKAGAKDFGDMLSTKDVKGLPEALQAKLKHLAEGKAGAEGSEAPADFGAAPAGFGDMLAPKGMKKLALPERELKEKAKAAPQAEPELEEALAAAEPLLEELGKKLAAELDPKASAEAAEAETSDLGDTLSPKNFREAKAMMQCGKKLEKVEKHCGADGDDGVINCGQPCKDAMAAIGDDCLELVPPMKESLAGINQACTGCGLAMMNLFTNAAACNATEGDLDTWTPCVSECHPYSCGMLKECGDDVQELPFGLSKKQMHKLHSQAEKSMKECPCK